MENHLPLISIIVPFYNEKQFLREAVESVIHQTYTHWELLLIDDGSDEASIQIAKEYSKAYPAKIFYFDHEGHANKGASPTRNLGLKHAKGKYCAFLDSDDYWLPAKLEKQVELAIQFPDVDFFCEASHYLNQGRNPNYTNKDVPVGIPPDKCYDPPALLVQLYPLGNGETPCPTSMFIKTDFLHRIGGFEESFGGSKYLFEDQAFAVKNYFHAKSYVSSLCNNVYRQRENSMMHKGLAKGNYRDGKMYFMRWFKSYLAAQPQQYPEVNRKFRDLYWQLFYPRLYKYTIGLWRKFFSKK